MNPKVEDAEQSRDITDPERVVSEAEPRVEGPTETSQTPENTKDSHWVTILSMALFVLLSLGAVAFLYYQNQQLKGMLATYQVQTTPAPSASQTPNGDLANWKIYSNEVQKVSFKYPPTWKLIEKEKGDIQNGRTYNSSIQLTKDGSEINVIFDLVGIGGGPRNVPYEEIILWGEKYYKQYGSMNFENGTKTVDISDSPTGLGAFQINSKTYMISLTYKVQNEGEKPGDELSNEFDQILSTFKFTETSSTSSSSPKPSL